MGIRKKIDTVINEVGKFIDDHDVLVASAIGMFIVGTLTYIICNSCYLDGYVAGEAAARATTAELIDKVTELYD